MSYNITAFVITERISRKGVSERGSQLVAADRELRDAVKGLDQNCLFHYGVNKAIKCIFTTPNGPWRNGCSKALIKFVKKAIKVAIGEQTLSFSELQTVSFETGDLINEIPILGHSTSPEDGTYLSPNLLLLSRASSRVPADPLREPTNLRKRFHLFQKIVNSFLADG